MRTSPVVATPFQHLLWREHGVHPAWFLALEVEGRLTAADLERAFERLVQRHDVLRAAFVAHDEVLHMPEVAPSALVEVIEREGDGDPVTALRQAIFRPFDLERPPLLRVGLTPLGEDRAVVALAAHHLVYDNDSLVRLLDELSALLSGSDDRALPPASSFLDEAGRITESAAPAALSAWWRRHLAGARWPLPVEHDVVVPVPALVSPEVLELDPHETDALTRVALAAGASIEAAIGLAFALALCAALDVDEAVTAWALSTRAPGRPTIVGPLLDNTLLRVRGAADGTLDDALQALSRQMTEVRGRMGLPFRDLTEFLTDERGAGAPAGPCPVLFTFHDADSMDIPPSIRGLLRGDRIPCGARTIRRLPAERRAGRRPYDYFAFAELREGRAALALRVQRRRVGLDAATRIADRWASLLRTLATDPTATLNDVVAQARVRALPPRREQPREGSRCPRP